MELPENLRWGELTDKACPDCNSKLRKIKKVSDGIVVGEGEACPMTSCKYNIIKLNKVKGRNYRAYKIHSYMSVEEMMDAILRGG